MNENEIIEFYRNASTEKLIELAKDISSIKPEFRNHLFAELSNRNEDKVVEEAEINLASSTISTDSTKEKSTGLDYLPWVLLLFPIGVIADLIGRFSLFSTDPSPASTEILVNLLFVAIYTVPVIYSFQKRFTAIWITIGGFTLWTLIFLLFAMANEGMNTRIGIEFVARFIILIYFLNAASEVYKLKKKEGKS